MPLAFVGATFFVEAAFAVLAAGFFAGLAFFFGLLFFGLLAAAGLLTFALVVFLAGNLLVFLTPKTSGQVLSLNVRKQARQGHTPHAKLLSIRIAHGGVTDCAKRRFASPKSKARPVQIYTADL